jgi:hypothetical protein
MKAGEYPDWYLCTGFWLAGSRGWGNPVEDFEHQTWFNANGIWIQSVYDFKNEGPFDRPSYIIPDPPTPVFPPVPRGYVLTDQQIADVTKKSGFKGQGWTTAVAVMLAESSGLSDAVGDINIPESGSFSGGLGQLNKYWHPECFLIFDAWRDPQYNSDQVYRISEGGINWSQWSTWKEGTYLEKWDRALAVTPTIQLPTSEELVKFAYEVCLGVPRESALMREGRRLGLIPLSEEKLNMINCQPIVGQVFGSGNQMVLLYCQHGKYDVVYSQDM